MKSYITLGEFVSNHSNDIIEIMTPCGYTVIQPNMDLSKLFVHAGTRETKTPIAWDELKSQVVESENCSFDEVNKKWYLISEPNFKS